MPYSCTCVDCLQILHRRHRNEEVRNLSQHSLHPDFPICRFGWFWECPNGGEKCQYRHALPPGFILKSERKAAEEAAKANVISLEEFLETEVDSHTARRSKGLILF